MISLAVFRTLSFTRNRGRHSSPWAQLHVSAVALAMAVPVLVPMMPPTANAADNGVAVDIANFTYSPQVITVEPGITVTWVNHDDIPHTVTETTKAFRSKPLDTDDTFAFTFTSPGDYSYFCSLHPHMTGEVIVKPKAG